MGEVNALKSGFYVTDSQLAPWLTWELCLDSAREVFREQIGGRVELTTPRVKKLTFLTAVEAAEGDPGEVPRYRVKGAAFPRHGIAGLRAVRAVLLSRWPSLETLGIVEENTNYARRVGAVTAAALEGLGQDFFESVCLFGAGRLARTTLEALFHRYALGSVTVFARSPESSQSFATSFAEDHEDACISAGSEPDEAVRNASLIITITTANEVLFSGSAVRDEAVVVSMGGGLELDFELLDRAHAVYVDDLEGCLESGDLAAAVQAECYRSSWVSGTIAEFLFGPQDGVPRSGPLVLIPRGIAAMDVMQAYQALKAMEADGVELGSGVSRP
jgi:ornithine cyclodeaminase/alanine dehydrogenase-like protein (mu-crystallin family)